MFFDIRCILSVENTLESPELHEGKMNDTAGRAVCDYDQTSGLIHFFRAMFPEETPLPQ